MNYLQFHNAIKEKKLASCYLLEGEEEHIKRSLLNELRREVVPDGLRELNENRLSNPTVDALRQVIETYPILTDRRLIIVTECGFLAGRDSDGSDEAKRFAACLDNVPPHAILVLYVRGNADGRKSVYQKLKARNAVVSFTHLDEAGLVRWIARMLKASGKVITQANAAYLSFYAGKDTAFLVNELEKLVAYTEERNEITQDDIEAVCVRSAECTVFQLTDEIVAGHTAKALAYFSQLLLSGSDRMSILQMMLRHYRILYHLMLMKRDGLGQAGIQSALGMPPFAVERAVHQARAYSLEALRHAVNRLIDTDFGIKSGSYNLDGTVENALLSLTQHL
jgi:DNA polymerase-3 subunit delta